MRRLPVILTAFAIAACGGSSSADIEQRLMDESRSELPETPRDSYSCVPKEVDGDFSCTVQVNDVVTYRFPTVREDGDRLFFAAPEVDLARER